MVLGRPRVSWSSARATRLAQGDAMARAGVSEAGGFVPMAEGAALLLGSGPHGGSTWEGPGAVRAQERRRERQGRGASGGWHVVRRGHAVRVRTAGHAASRLRASGERVQRAEAERVRARRGTAA